MQKLSHQTHSFAEFTLDLTRGCLQKGTDEIKLRPKSFEVLTYLVENNGRLIAKNELIRAVWLDTAVTDDSLVQCLKDIRHALGDEKQQIIKTVHGRGYIFDKEVSENGAALVTTYTEETAGVQVIIEEGESNAQDLAEVVPWVSSRNVELMAPKWSGRSGRLTTAIAHHRKVVALGTLALAVSAAAIFYATRPGEAIDSVAVMPFVNVSGDPNTEYLSEGISDGIIDRLSRLPNFKVIALNSVLRYKGQETDPQEIGRKLNVRSVLMSRLVQRGDELTINVELVDVRDNRRLWGQQYSRKMSEIMTVPTEIAQDVSQKLRLRLTGDEERQLSKRYTQSNDAYQLHMLGRYWRRRFSQQGFNKSIAYLEQATKKDPTYAPAYAELGEVYRNLTWHGLLPAKEGREKEEWATLKALQIDNTLAEAHVLMANLKEIDLDWTGAEQEYRRALELDPNSVRAHETYAWNLEMVGRMDEALRHLRKAQELDPLSLDISWDIGVWFTFSRQPDRAIEQFQKAIAIDPNFGPAHAGIVNAYQAKGRHEEAIAELKKASTIQDRKNSAQLGYAYAVAGRTDETRKILADLSEVAKQRFVSPFDFALLYIGLGEKDQAFEFLNKTFDENPYRIAFIKVNPRFDVLRSDARFSELLRRMKLM
jgi:TolB-like protein/DNA-binding winged helix-turn-helix (wHTH) protein/Tfp pilus assembly protein PilF